MPLNSDAEYDGQTFSASKNIRYFRITKWVTDKKENSIEKLVNVYANLSNENRNFTTAHRNMRISRVWKVCKK